MYYMSYGPYISIAIVLVILFILWAFWGGKQYEFVGLAPLNPDTCSTYTGSLYNWGNTITPAEPLVSFPQNDVINNVPEINQVVPPHDIQIDIPNVPQEVTAPVISLVVPPIIPRADAVCNIIPPKIKPQVKQQIKQKRGRQISKGERICCETMEKIYGVKFRTVRPGWLANPETGHNLELDCYNDELKIAVEYNGIQHYEWPNFTPMTYEEFIDQHRRDRYKKETCDSNGVYLIVVPHTVTHKDIPSFIIEQLPETIRNRLRGENLNIL